ncbi:ImmA/IrrE family metallo-endopeptidase [Paenisporosarcina sp. TG-14]|uniref:ImmA/IrrE family metallo-endopeptidase n=1 Tax=Paenisporosarcina sp. TG-14 TaxID=1231057 RepID=UPI0003730F32|nr:ImmA/IrrE family metallo-endopeptidase [Paenisporosarcina sp. TG-14]
MKKQYSLLEDYIQKLYKKFGICHPNQLNIETVSSRLGLVVYYIPHKPMYIAGNVFLDARKSRQEQWQSYGHELCHALWHNGNQHVIPKPFRDYQEIKANNFAQHACIPTFMLQRLDLAADNRRVIYLIMQTFNVDYRFAEKRLMQYQAKLMFNHNQSKYN